MKTTLSAVMGATLALCAIHVEAQVDRVQRQIPFAIQTQTLADALDRWAEQSGFQLFSSDWELARKFAAPKLEGSFTAQAALERLLEGTPLTYSWLEDGRAVTIRERRKSPAESVRRDAEPQSLAAQLGEDRGREPKPLQVASAAHDESTQHAHAAAHREELEMIVVVGTHIRGAAPVGSAVTTYSRKQILDMGVATLDQFARKLPQNFSSVDALPSPSAAALSALPQDGANMNRGAGFNLRGIGPGATLTLVNGRRLAPSGSFGEFVDISLIPFAAVERVEIMGDGASALYGADAIAGVVNIVLRDDFDGAESNVRYGTTEAGGNDHLTLSQAAGTSWDGGSALLVYEYDDRTSLRVDQRDFLIQQSGPFFLLPEQRRNSIVGHAQQQLFERADTTLDAYYSDRDFVADSTIGGIFSHQSGSGTQYGGTLGVGMDFAAAWRADLSGTLSKVEQSSANTIPGFQLATTTAPEMTYTSGRLIVDGPLMQWRDSQVKAAIGVEYSKEKLKRLDATSVAGTALPTVTQQLSRDVSSAFAEILVPLVDASSAVPGMKRLEVSLAGRYDDYNDVGSSTNPKYGILWSPIDGLNVRGTYGTSFHAPSLIKLFDQNSYLVFPLPNSASPSFSSNTVILQGNGNSSLDPETATIFTAGFDFAPTQDFEFSATYFNIDFKDRVSVPPIIGNDVFNIWSQFEGLAPFFHLAPSTSELDAILNGSDPVFNPLGLPASSIDAIFDNRPQNIAVTKESGVEATVNVWNDSSMGRFGFMLSGSYVLETEFQAAASSPAIVLNNKIGQPADLRLRGTLNWVRGGFASTLSLNYIDKYENPLPTPTQHVGSWATADFQLSYRGTADSGVPLLDGLLVSVAIENIADKEPPAILATRLGFDGGNANPLGRAFAIYLSKAW